MPGGCFCFCCLDYVIKKCEIRCIFWSKNPFGSLVFFSYCRPIEPIGSGPALWGITGLKVRSWSWPATESDRENPATKGGCLRYREFLVQMWRIRTWWRSWWSQHHWDHFLRQKMVFFFGENRLFCKKPMLAMRIRTVWVRARMLSWF